MTRRALLTALAATLIALVGAAGFPAGALASLTPTVGVIEPTGSAAASTGSIELPLGFNPSPGDSLRDFSVTLPPGMLINLETDGGACLGTAAPTPACQVGSGYATLNGAGTPMALYLVAPPGPSFLAGVQLVAGPLSLVGTLGYHSSSNVGIQPSFDAAEQLSWHGVPPSPLLTGMILTLGGVTFPSSCQPAGVVLTAYSVQLPVPAQATAQVPVSNCLALPYQPTVVVQLSRDTGSTGAELQLRLITPSADSTTQQLRFQLPLNLQLNPAMAPCFEGAPCPVGDFTASSPLFPAGWLGGTLMLSGTARQPVLGMTFAPPVGLQLNTIFSPASLEVYNIPDIPMSSLTINFRGNVYGAMFIGLCYKSLWKAVFNPWSGEAMGPTSEQVGESGIPNCYHPPSTLPGWARPSGSAQLSSPSAYSARLAIETAKGRGAPGIVAVAVSLPSSLSFNPGTSLSTGHVLSVSGATLATANLRHGTLLVRFKHATARSRLLLRSPLLSSHAVGTARRSTAAGAQHVLVRVTDSRGRQTKLMLPLSVR